MNLFVRWEPDPATAADIVGSTITATPTGGSTAPILTGTGNANGGLVTGLQPSTIYAITVTNNDAGGTVARQQPDRSASVRYSNLGG